MTPADLAGVTPRLEISIWAEWNPDNTVRGYTVRAFRCDPPSWLMSRHSILPVRPRASTREELAEVTIKLGVIMLLPKLTGACSLPVEVDWT